MKLMLIGAGNMGKAMIEGLKDFDLLVVAKPYQIENLQKEFSEVKFSTQIPNLDDFVVLVCVKPSSFYDINFEGEARAVISVMASTTIKQLKEKINAKYFIRAMPNMAAMKLKSTTPLCGDEAFKDDAMEIMNMIGSSFWLKSEDELDIAMALVGCSPAWLALVAESLSDGAVSLGLNRALSYEMIASLFEGLGATLKDIHPAILKDKITSPKGTTIEGIRSLERHKIRSAFFEAMDATYRKNEKLSKK